MPERTSAPGDTTSPFWKRVFLFNLTPATSGVVVAITPELHASESRPDPSLNLAGHILLSLLYFPTCLVFAAFVMYTWTIRPKIESFEVVPSSAYPPVDVAITVNCSNPPWCGNMSLLVNYSSSCPVSANALHQVSASESAAGSVIGPVVLPLCYVGPQIFNTISTLPFFPVPGVMAEFTAINPGWNASTPPFRPTPERFAFGIVTISSVSGNGATQVLTPIRVVTVDSWQVKTALVGQTITKDLGELSASIYSMGIQYEGKRPSWRGTCLVAMTAFSNLRTFSRTSTVTVLESLGTSSYGSLIVLMAFVWIIPVLRLLLPAPDFIAVKQSTQPVPNLACEEERKGML
jgi:hypothetical protein